MKNINKNINGASVYVTSREELQKYKEGMTILGNKILNNLNNLGINKEGALIVEKIDGTLKKVISGECIIKN